jgi:hypothetical protein
MHRAPAHARPPREARLSRFVYGFGLPVRILRSLMSEPGARRRYLRVVLTQLAIVLVVGILVSILGHAHDTWSGGISAKWARLVALASAFYATLGVVEWIVVALSRDYHDQLSREASLLSGALPEDPERVPRVRVDLGWMKRKLRRKVRGFLAIAIGVPAVWTVSLVPIAGKLLYPMLALLWTTYWVGVFTAGRSGFAFRTEGAPGAPEPWFMRVADRATNGTFLGKLGLPRLYVIVWRNLSAGLFPPARELEAQPYEMFGIAAFRALLLLPGMSLFFRPILPVASAHVLTTPLPEASLDAVSEPRALSSYPDSFPRPAPLPALEARAHLSHDVTEVEELAVEIEAPSPREGER